MRALMFASHRPDTRLAAARTVAGAGRDSRNGGKIWAVRLTSSIVFRRIAAWPQSLQWVLLTLAAILLALAVGWVLFVPAADWLAAHDVGHVTGTSRTVLLQTARDAARGRLLTYGAGLFAAAALIFTARNFTVSRRTLDLTEQGQVTDRYTKAIEQLGSEKPDVRIGGSTPWNASPVTPPETTRP